MTRTRRGALSIRRWTSPRRPSEPRARSVSDRWLRQVDMVECAMWWNMTAADYGGCAPPMIARRLQRVPLNLG